MLISLKKTQIDFMSIGNLKHAFFPAFTGICQFHENGTEVISDFFSHQHKSAERCY